MKKQLFSIAMAFLIGMGGAMAQSVPNRGCGTMEYLQEQLKNDPAMRLRMQQIEQQTQNYLLASNANKTATVVTIPVVFHVLYSTNNTTQNISDARINEQLHVLNLDFSHTNADAGNAPGVFLGLAANTNIQFCLAVRDPNGAATTGIIRKQTATTSFIDDNGVKFNASGGDNAWPAASYLNIWVCNLGGGLLGYAQFPGGTASTDGVVLLNGSVGGPAAPGTSTPYHLGRTATHEVGHWLNLRHIWGDANCGNDQVSDTPTQQTSNFGCPGFPHVTCANGPNGDMFMNYMDYVDDNCMNLFTAGQSTRSNALFAVGGARVGLTTSQGCVPVGGGCGVPTSLAALNIQQTTAAINWLAVAGATSYKVQYRVNGTTTWTTKTATTSPKVITGLLPGTNYQYRVRAVCNGVNSAYTSIKTFTTASSCTDTYEPNNTFGTAKVISPNTDIYAIISTASDTDWFKVTTTAAAPKVKVTLDGLPADYDVFLYKSSNGALLGYSQLSGTAAETIIYNGNTTGIAYKILVYGYAGAYSPSCYHLKASTSATNWREMGSTVEQNEQSGAMSLYPNPANDQLTINLVSDKNQTSTINVVDMIGRNVLNIQKDLAEGVNKLNVDLSTVQKGIYTVRVNMNGENLMQKLVIEK